MRNLDHLFHRWPALIGFSVQEVHGLSSDRQWVQLDDTLALADVGLYEWIPHEEKLELLADMAQSLLELLDERDEAHELLRGRTFARTLH
jgi:hypothetical protein